MRFSALFDKHEAVRPVAPEGEVLALELVEMCIRDSRDSEYRSLIFMRKSSIAIESAPPETAAMTAAPGPVSYTHLPPPMADTTMSFFPIRSLTG